jgi:hypothetical chaperone protein
LTACGLDFGTSNTTLGTMQAGAPKLVPLEGGNVTIPSAIFYSPVRVPEIGRAAITAYIDGVEGRLMRSIKSVLGSALIDERTVLGRERAPFRRVIADYIRIVKARAEKQLGHELTAVVHGRPVHFVDGDEAGDKKAEDALKKIAHEIGFKHVLFQYEPIAAALDYEQRVDHEEIALIADIGGGTSDFSIIRLGPARREKADRADDILANDGVRIGGTDFDRKLSLEKLMPHFGFGSEMKRDGLGVPNSYFHDLATWHSINRLYDPKLIRQLHGVEREAAEPHLIARLIRLAEERRGHALAGQVEAAKIALSEEPETQIALDWLEAGFAVGLTQEDLAHGTAALASAIGARIKTCLDQAQLGPDKIDALFLTGGSTRLAHVRAAIAAGLPGTKLVEGDIFGSVGTGLALEAGRRFS